MGSTAGRRVAGWGGAPGGAGRREGREVEGRGAGGGRRGRGGRRRLREWARLGERARRLHVPPRSGCWIPSGALKSGRLSSFWARGRRAGSQELNRRPSVLREPPSLGLRPPLPGVCTPSAVRRRPQGTGPRVPEASRRYSEPPFVFISPKRPANPGPISHPVSSGSVYAV